MVGDCLGIYAGVILLNNGIMTSDYVVNTLEFLIGLIIAIFLIVLFSTYFFINLKDKWEDSIIFILNIFPIPITIIGYILAVSFIPFFSSFSHIYILITIVFLLGVIFLRIWNKTTEKRQIAQMIADRERQIAQMKADRERWKRWERMEGDQLIREIQNSIKKNLNSSYELAVKINLQHEKLWNDMGVEFMNKGLYNKSMNCFEKAIKINHQSQEVWNNIEKLKAKLS